MTPTGDVKSADAALRQLEPAAENRRAPTGTAAGVAMLLLCGGLLLGLVVGLFALRAAEPVAPLDSTGTARQPVEAEAGLERPRCLTSAILVPECGRWWGVAPAALTSAPKAEALAEFEANIDRPVDIYHSYHRDDELFPTAEELRIARDPAGRRLLLVNWKPSTTVTWRAVADGTADARIDALAVHIRRTFPERFFLTVWHEPENDVDPTPGSGMTAADYAAMHRHVVTRLRNGGVTNAVTVMTYMGSPAWGATPWFSDLYPGDDVIDWIGVDPYIHAVPRARVPGRFRDIVNRTGRSWTGFYDWAQATHPDKPIMLAEWGVFHSADEPARKASVMSTALQDIHEFPAIKALVYFDSPHAPKGDTRIDSTAESLDAFTVLGHSPEFIGPVVPR